MEVYNQMMKNFIEMQQKTFGFFYDNTKIPMLPFGNEYNEIMENNLKFHKAALTYHDSVIKMMEAIKDNMNILTLKDLKK